MYCRKITAHFTRIIAILCIADIFSLAGYELPAAQFPTAEFWRSGECRVFDGVPIDPHRQRARTERFTTQWTDGGWTISQNDSHPSFPFQSYLVPGDAIPERDKLPALGTHIQGSVIQYLKNSESIEYIEHFFSGEESIEVSWILASKPQTDQSIHFWLISDDACQFTNHPDSANWIRVENTSHPDWGHVDIGEAVLIDALGVRTTIPPWVDGHSVRWRIPPEVLENASYPICLDPTIGPEFGVPLISVSNNTNPQFSPAVIPVGDHYFAVWADQIDDGNHRIWGTRIDSFGNVLDPGGFLISGNSGDNINPALAYGIDTVLVVWEERANRSNSRILGMLLSSESGKSLLSEPVEIMNEPLNQQIPCVAAASNQYLVACQSEIERESRKEFDILIQRVDATGRVPDAKPTYVTQSSLNQSRPCITAGDDDFQLIWEDLQDGRSSQIYGTTIAAGELPATFAPIQLTDTGSSIINPSLVRHDGSTFIVFQMRGEEEKYGIYGMITDFSGSHEPVRFPISIIQDTEDKTRPAIAHTSSGFLVAWEFSSTQSGFLRKNIQAKRLNNDLSPVSDEIIQITEHQRPQSNPCMASMGPLTITMWEDFRSGDNNDIYYRMGLVNESDDSFIHLTTEQIASNAPSDQTDPATLFIENIAHIAWSEMNDTTGYDIYMIRVDRTNNQIVDANPVIVTQSPGDQRNVRLASAFNRIYLVWESTDETNRTTLQGTSVPVGYETDAVPAVLELTRTGGNFRTPSLAVGDRQILLVYQTSTTRGQDQRIAANYYDAQFSPINPSPIILSELSRAARNPDVSFVGSEFVFSFEERHPNSFWGIRAGWVPGVFIAGRIPDFFHEPEPEFNHSLPALATHEDAISLVWMDESDEASEEKILRWLTFIREEAGEFVPQNPQSVNESQASPDISFSVNGIHDNAALFWAEMDGSEEKRIVVSRLNHDGLNTLDFGKFLVTPDINVSQMASDAHLNHSIIAYTSEIPPNLGKILYRFATVENSPRLSISEEVLGTNTSTTRLPLTRTANVSDYDSNDFGGGRLEIQLDAVTPQDKIELFSSENDIRIQSNSVFVNDQLSALFSGGNFGQSRLEMILTSTATPAVVETIVRAVHYNFERVELENALTTRTGTISLFDGNGGASSPARFTVRIESQSGPPEIRTLSPSRTVNPGESVSISANVAGALPLNYQWYFNGSRLPSQRSSILTINSFSFLNSGSYTLEVTNTAGRIVSQPVLLELVTVDLCVRWRSEIGKVYHVVGKVITSDANWSSVSPAIQATQTQSEFCLPLTSPFRLFEVRDGEPPTFTIQDPTDPVTPAASIQGDQVCLTWSAIPGAPYRIDSKRPSETQWTQVGEFQSFQTFIGRYCIQPTDDSRLYRIFGPPIASTKPITISIQQFSIEDGMIRFEWEGIQSRFYQVQYSSNFSRGWQNFTSTVEETDFEFRFEQPMSLFNSEATFFRVLQLP